MALPGDCHLIWRAIHELAACQFLHQVRVGILFHEGDAMFKAGAIVLELRQQLLLHAKLGLGVLKRQNTPIAPNGIGTEISNDCQRHGRDNQHTKNAGNRTLDSHSANESHSDSQCQQSFC